MLQREKINYLSIIITGIVYYQLSFSLLYTIIIDFFHTTQTGTSTEANYISYVNISIVSFHEYAFFNRKVSPKKKSFTKKVKHQRPPP